MDTHVFSSQTMTVDSSKRHHCCGSARSSHLSITTRPMLLVQPQYSLLLVIVSILCCIMPLSGVFLKATNDLCTKPNVVNASLCTPRESFHNTSANCCQRCSTCSDTFEVRTPCSGTSDTYCVPSCSHRALSWNKGQGACVIECSFCSYKCDPVANHCMCDPSLCWLPSDIYCETPIPCVSTTPTRPTVNIHPPGNPSSLPPWGVGVIAVGAVLGIVAFSAGFLLMGVCTRRKRAAVPESSGSDNSESVLVSNSGRSSHGTHSTYISGYPNQSLLDLLRNTSTPVHSSLSSIHSSPRSARASPFPVRTVQVKLDHNHLHSNLV